MMGREEKILVLVRLRPLSDKEIANNEVADWECINGGTILYRNSLQERSGLPTAYSFDRVFSGDCSTRQVYEEGTKEIALSVVSGINSSIFAYGQTSSGKTYTMNGITEHTVADIYDYILRHEERAFALKFSAMEIYNENVRDLLSSNNTLLRILDDPEKGTIVEKLTEEMLTDLSHLKKLLSICEAQRKIGETSLNEQSSRSHQILKLTIESSAHEFIGKGKSSTLSASVFFIDLAGSERASQAMSAGSRLKEGCHINRSLLTLGNVIRKLSKGRQGHINYRDSKLTRILQPCLGGNARTSIICTLSPARSHVDQSKNTLLFASCAKEVTTNAQVNVVMSDKALVKHLQKELARLESELNAPAPMPSSCHCSVVLRKKDLQLEKMEKEIRELTKQRDLAQSRIEDLLQLISNDQSPDKPEGCMNHGHWKSHDKWEDEYSISDSSVNIHRHMDDIHDEEATDSIENPSSQPLTDLNNHCKEVRCIELAEPKTDTDCLNTHISQGGGSHPNGFSYGGTLQQRIQDVQRSIDSLTGQYLDDPISTSRSLDLTRSHSCRRRRGSFGKVNSTRLSRNVSVSSMGTDVADDMMSQSEEIDCVQTFVENLKNAKIQYEKQLKDDQLHDETRRAMRETGFDHVINYTANSSDSTLQFEKLRRAILVLWQSCNVSLVHRTYFFLLFKDDSKDSVYLEVELRRLSFLKETFSQGDQTLASSEKALRKERGMLSKLVHRRFSSSERKNLYEKWGIALDFKRRRLQLISKLWTDADDMDHVIQSATIVGKLVKFSNHKCALKGMFGLSFSPPGLKRRSSGWIGRRASLT